MEKLQKALQKARDQRTTAGAANAMSRVAAHPVENGEFTGLEALWAELAPHEPDRQALDRNLLVSLTADQKAAPFDILRTKTQLLMQKNGWSRLGITSATPACGKTTLACNLALGFARQRELRVILVELDLRRPSMGKMLGIHPEKDLTDLMSGNADFAEQAIRLHDNVAVAIARSPAPDPSSILLSRKTHAVLREIEEIYQPDLMIFDLPPLLVGDDTRAFLKEVDCALIVAKAEATSIAQIDACEREVAEQTNVLGVVLNQCRHISDTDYGYEAYGEGR